MANEIRTSISVDYTNALLKDPVATDTVQITQAAQELWGAVVSVGSGGEEDLLPVDITTNGVLYLKNLDTTNFVKYGPKSAGVMVEYARLKAGESALLRLAPGITMRWIADTAAVKVKVKLFGN